MFGGKEIAKLTLRVRCKNDSAFMVEKVTLKETYSQLVQM